MEFNRQFNVHTLEELISSIIEFADGDMVWFRGHENSEYSLLPTLYRNKTVDFIDENKNYNSIHYAEDMRMQQYYAKNYPFIKDSGKNKTEWLGMAQHFGINTRFFDWSTSAFHSLVFALNQFFDSNESRNTAIPCLWILKPQKLNKIIIDEITCNATKMARRIIDNLSVSAEEIKSILALFDMLEKNYDQYKKIFVESNPNNNWRHLDYIYNPAYFDKLIEAAKTNPRLAFSGHTINPLFYLLANAYIEGDSMESDILMTTPLAIIHPINNERIRSQHGVFTLFPFPSHRLYTSYNNLDYFKMENNSKIKGTLCKINILFPKKISEELKVLGTHKSWLFYEQDRISQEIESGL
jgi:hypothetical protein